MLTKKPERWRDGQTIFNFLEWLGNNKNLPTSQSVRMADPFHTTDAELNSWYEEFLKKMKN